MLGKQWVPYEAHLPYLLQLKLDLNLAGMGWLRLQRPLFRRGAAALPGCRP